LRKLKTVGKILQHQNNYSYDGCVEKQPEPQDAPHGFLRIFLFGQSIITGSETKSNSFGAAS
jgi:hypothetical protein